MIVKGFGNKTDNGNKCCISLQKKYCFWIENNNNESCKIFQSTLSPKHFWYHLNAFKTLTYEDILKMFL